MHYMPVIMHRYARNYARLCKNMHVMHMQKAPIGGENQNVSDRRASVCGEFEPLKMA